MTFKPEVKNAIAYRGTVCCICLPFKKTGSNKVYQIPVEVHEDTVTLL